VTPTLPSSSELERFRSALGERLGLWLDDTKLPELSALLSRRAGARELAPAQYLAVVDDTARGSEERRVLAQELTITETYFFRQGDQLTALADQLEAHTGPLSILSAGCASGEEPYSIAMTLRARLPHLAAHATIRAVDINPAILERAKAGVYSSWALRETPESVARRWFRRQGSNTFALDREIRASVTFQERNLIEQNQELLTPATYHAIFFRNVVMYFTPRAQAEVIARLAQALTPGGVLFLGYAETLRGLSTAFHLRHSRNTFYYQKREGSPAAALPRARDADRQATVEATDELGLHWFEAIAQASERVRKLTTTSHREVVDRTADRAPEAGAAFDLEPAFALLRKERFGDALDAMQALPQAATLDPDVLLLRCALLVHSGKLEAARATCSALLARDELNAGAHYLLALVCEGERDLGGAAEHNRIAAHLDPAFAMPRLHLGLLARRSGDTLAARRELRQAYALLEREDTARLLLFAGGFERNALLALCRTELAACGGAL
jgi:chemotaxis protein methyltransferase CheR